MPNYVYECQHCGEFETEQSIVEPALGSCPTCGAAVRRLIAGRTGIIVKDRGTSVADCDRTVPCCGRQTRCDVPPCRG